MCLDLNLPGNKQLVLLNFRPGGSTRKIAAFERNEQRRAAAKKWILHKENNFLGLKTKFCLFFLIFHLIFN